MKVELIRANERELKYPLLAADDDGLVVLLTSARHGVVVADATGCWRVGQYREDWAFPKHSDHEAPRPALGSGLRPLKPGDQVVITVE